MISVEKLHEFPLNPQGTNLSIVMVVFITREESTMRIENGANWGRNDLFLNQSKSCPKRHRSGQTKNERDDHEKSRHRTG